MSTLDIAADVTGGRIVGMGGGTEAVVVPLRAGAEIVVSVHDERGWVVCRCDDTISADHDHVEDDSSLHALSVEEIGLAVALLTA